MVMKAPVWNCNHNPGSLMFDSRWNRVVARFCSALDHANARCLDSMAHTAEGGPLSREIFVSVNSHKESAADKLSAPTMASALNSVQE